MTAADQIAELERQRAEGHMLLDAVYHERVRAIQKACKHSRSWATYWHPIHGPQRIYSVKCRHCGLEY